MTTPTRVPTPPEESTGATCADGIPECRRELPTDLAAMSSPISLLKASSMLIVRLHAGEKRKEMTLQLFDPETDYDVVACTRLVLLALQEAPESL
jgi:hypothetical protein